MTQDHDKICFKGRIFGQLQFWPFYSKFYTRKWPKSLLHEIIYRFISQSIFYLFSIAWHRFDQGKELFQISISFDHYTIYSQSWVFEPNNLSRPTSVPIWVRGPKIHSKVTQTSVGTWSIVIFEIIFANDDTWLPP